MHASDIHHWRLVCLTLFLDNYGRVWSSGNEQGEKLKRFDIEKYNIFSALFNQCCHIFLSLWELLELSWLYSGYVCIHVSDQSSIDRYMIEI